MDRSNARLATRGAGSGPRPSGEWEYQVWISVPGKSELIKTPWRPACVATLGEARANAAKPFFAGDPFVSCTDESGNYYLLAPDKIQWIRIETRETNGP